VLNKLLPSVLIILALGIANPAAAQMRRIPPNLARAQLMAISYPNVQLGDRVYPLAPGALIYSAQNTTLLPSQVPVGAIVKVKFNPQGQIQTLWILTPQEMAGQ